MQIPREQIWQEKLCQLTGPSYLESVRLNDIDSKRKIDLTVLKQPIHTTIKNKIMFVAMIIFILGCLGLWIVAYMHSTLPRLTNGVDFRADACGTQPTTDTEILVFSGYPAISGIDNLCELVSGRNCIFSLTQANYVCLYDENGTDYNLTTQGHLCYQTIQSSNQGKYCMPYQPISSDVLNKHLSQSDSYLNRLLSDIGNSWANILLCVVLSMLLGCLTNLFLLRRAIFIKLSGWIATVSNLLLMLLLITLSFLQLSSYQRKYCIGSQPDECLFGNVLTYKALSYLLVALAVLFTLCQLIAFRKIRASTDLGGIGQTLSSEKIHVGVEVVILISKLILTLFFGSLILMAASDSQIVQTNVPDIAADTINLIKYNTRRYWVAGLGLLMYIISARTLEKIRYFVVAIDTVNNLSVKEAVCSTICHSGQLLIIVLLETLLFPLWLLSRFVYWIFSDIDKSSSTNRYLQEHILFFPQLWLYSHLFRYLKDQALVFLPYDLTYAQRIRLYHLMDIRRYLKLKMLDSVKFCSRQVGLFLSLFAAVIAIALSNMTKTIIGLPTTLTENQLIPVIATFLLCLLLVSTNTFICVPFIEAIFSNHQLLMESGRQSAAKDMRQKYHKLFDGQNDQLQVTKEHLNQTVMKTEGIIQQPSYEPDLIKIQ